MKIAVLYNEGAGDGLSLAQIRGVLEYHGHDVVHVIEKDSEFARVFDGETELVVAAGGDGTVWRAANALIGQEVPLAVLPTGTANNIASSLGIQGEVDDVVSSWARAERRAFDIGQLKWGSSECRIVEGVGGGLIPAGINAVEQADAASNDDDEEAADDKVVRALRTYREVLSKLRPCRCALVLDGVRREGEFLLVEVLNIRSVGPQIVLAPDADVSDGAFDVVIAEEADRSMLDDYLQRRIAGQDIRLQLPTQRASEILIEGLAEMHIDDEVRQSSPGAEASITIDHAALEVLQQPARAAVTAPAARRGTRSPTQS